MESKITRGSNHNRQTQKAMKVGRCGMARAQVQQFSDKPVFPAHWAQQRMKQKPGM